MMSKTTYNTNIPDTAIVLGDKTSVSCSAGDHLSPIESVIKSGFCPHLIISVAPRNALGIADAGLGKTPALPTGEPGYWKPLAKWQHGINDAERKLAIEAGANAGLILGNPLQGQQYVALDFDLLTGTTEEDFETKIAIAIKQRAIRTIVNAIGGNPIWVRDSRPGRAAVLFRMDPAQATGRKDIVHLTSNKYGDVGKIEVLARGQQVVIAGEHSFTQQPLQWWRTDAPDVRVQAPTVDEAIPVLKDRDGLNKLLELVLASLGNWQITGQRSRTASDLSNTVPQVLRAEDQAPPSGDIFIRLFDRMPHDKRVTREDYVMAMHAAVGCIRALQELGRTDDAEVSRMGAAAIQWAARWVDPKGVGSNIAAEVEKWKTDWWLRSDIHSGWFQLMNLGVRMGLEDLRLEDAAYGFEALEPAPIVEADIDAEKGPRAQKAAETTRPRIRATPLRPWGKTPPREWLYGEELAKKYVSVTGAPGGAGKSAYAVTVALAVATGRALHHRGAGRAPKHLRVHQQGAVWWYNLEDPNDELDRRIEAAAIHHRIDYDDVKDWFFADSGREQPLVIAKKNSDSVAIVTPMVAELAAELIDRGIKLLIVDPFVSCHELTENLNEDINFVMKLWGKVADKADCAIWLIHHFRKGGTSGDAEAFRGAASLQGAARAMTTIGTMTIEEAKKLGVPEEQRWRHVRLDNAKQNMSPPAEKARWFKLVGVDLHNGNEMYPEGDSVQTLEAWTPPEAFEGIDWTLAESILHDIDEGAEDGQLYTVGKKCDRWAGHVIVEHTGRTEEQVRGILKEWKDGHVFREERYPSPLPSRKGKEDKGVKVNWDIVHSLKRESPHSARGQRPVNAVPVPDFQPQALNADSLHDFKIAA